MSEISLPDAAVSLDPKLRDTLAKTLEAEQIHCEAVGADAQHVAGNRSAGFNYNKLLAVLCISASAAVSVWLISWIVRKFL